METTLTISSTEITPEVNFDLTANTFLIKGRSMPEDAEKFYSAIILWLRSNLDGSGREANFDVVLDYYNTGSFIRLMALFNVLHEFNGKGHRFKVRWICEADDEDNVDDGRSFQEVLKIPFEIIEL